MEYPPFQKKKKKKNNNNINDKKNPTVEFDPFP